MKNNGFFKILIGIAAVGALAGLALRGRSSVEAVEASWSGNLLRSRTSGERVFKKVGFRQAYTIGGPNADAGDLLNPLILRTDGSDHAYVVDYGDFTVKKVSPEGRIVGTFGKGRGQGPGELNNPTDLAIAPNGEVWVCDPPNGSITIFSPDGAIRDTLRLSSRPFRLLLRPDGGFLVRPENPVDGLIEEYGADGSLLRRYGRLFSRQEEISIALDGWIAMSPRQEVLFAPLRLGILAAFRDGELKYVAETLEEVPMPRVETSPNGLKRVDPKAPVVQLGVGSYDGNIYVNTAQRQSSGTYRVFVDLYDLEGRYLHSIETPHSGSTMELTETSLFVLNQGILSRFATTGSAS
jgi:hypothetical protein